MRNDTMTYVIKTASGSVYEVDLDAQRFRRLQGKPDTVGSKYAVWTPLVGLVIGADPRYGVKFLRELMPDGGFKATHTSAIVEGHHELYWAEYHRVLEPARPDVN